MRKHLHQKGGLSQTYSIIYLPKLFISQILKDMYDIANLPDLAHNVLKNPKLVQISCKIPKISKFFKTTGILKH